MLTCCFLHHVRLLFLFLKLFVSARLLRSSSLIALLLRDSPIQSIYREASSRQSSLYFPCQTLFKTLIAIAEAKMHQSLDLVGKL